MMAWADINSILVLGDSVSRGVVLHPQKKRYVFSPRGFIRRLAEQLRPQVCDLSKFGSTTSHGRSLLDEKFDGLNPGLVLIEYGSNDCDYPWDAVAKEPYATHLPKLSLRQYAANIRALILSVRERGGIPVLTNLHPLDSQSYFNWFTKNDPERQRATMQWLKNVHNIYWWQEMYSYALERIAGALGAFVVDVRGAFLREADYRAYLCGDGIHPNEAGHALMEQVFLRVIRTRAPGLL
jgi:lysophospholipase L1-like esterase